MNDLPNFGVRVMGIFHSGKKLEVFRRKMPRGGWTWGSPYRGRNYHQCAFISWEKM